MSGRHTYDTDVSKLGFAMVFPNLGDMISRDLEHIGILIQKEKSGRTLS